MSKNNEIIGDSAQLFDKLAKDSKFLLLSKYSGFF